jgi:hypothetical protein
MNTPYIAKTPHRQQRPLHIPYPVLFLLFFLIAGGCASTPYPPPSRDVSACFYDFTDIYVKRIHTVLTRAPGVNSVQRLPYKGEEPEQCLCYQLLYSGNMEELKSWLINELPTSTAVPFRIVPTGNRRLEVYFDGGFR